MIRTILLGLDDSPGSRRACEWTAQLAANLEAEVVAVGVANPAPYYRNVLPETASLMPDMEAIEQGVAEALAGDWTQPLRDARVRYRTVVVTGLPADRLIECAGTEHADLVVVGTHSRGVFGELVHGSVSHALAQHAHLPVVVVPCPPKGAEQPSAEHAEVPAAASEAAAGIAGRPLDE